MEKCGNTLLEGNVCDEKCTEGKFIVSKISDKGREGKIKCIRERKI